METLGFIHDNKGAKYNVLFKRRNRNDMTRFYFEVRDGDTPIGNFEFDKYDDEDNASIDDAFVEPELRSRGIYNSFLRFARDFFKKNIGCGIISRGISRNALSDSAWSKVKDARKEEVEIDGRKYIDYTLENIKTFGQFEGSDYTIYTNTKGGKFWGDEGAGVLIIAKDTKRILVAMRSDFVNEPGTYGIFGGAIDKGESPEDAAKREVREEAGYNGKFQLLPAYVFVSPSKDFRYSNFIGIVDKEFEPEYDWETAWAEWVTLDELLKLEPKHFGLKALLKNSDKLIRSIIK